MWPSNNFQFLYNWPMDKNNKFSVKEISLIFVLIGGVGLVSIKLIGSKYHGRVSSEMRAIKSILDLTQKTLSNEKACINTFAQIPLSYSQQSLHSIVSENNYKELKVGSLVSNNYFFGDMSVQVVDRNKDQMTLLHKLSFKNTNNGKLVRIFRFFHTKVETGRTIASCKMGRTITMSGNEYAK